MRFNLTDLYSLAQSTAPAKRLMEIFLTTAHHGAQSFFHNTLDLQLKNKLVIFLFFQGPWMRMVIGLHQAFQAHLRIPLRCRKALMSKQFLNTA